MQEQTDFEREMAQLLISALELDDVTDEEIVPTAPLFSHESEGLGLDSIDALEIALAINQKYGIKLRADDKENKSVFATLRSLSDYVQAERASA